MKILLFFKSFLSRTLFLLHGVISVYLVVNNNNEPRYWAFSVPIILLVIETCYTLTLRKGNEFIYFWPSGFLYILTMIPIIWVIELQLLDERIQSKSKLDVARAQSNNNTINVPTIPNVLVISNEVIGKKVCELGIIIGLITGRWLMPRGSITRDQLSALLLGYVGNAADILELFETFEEPNIRFSRPVTVAVIIVYSWSIFQFTLVTTATIKDKKDFSEDSEKQSGSCSPKKNQVTPVQEISKVHILRDKKIQKKYIDDIRTRKTSLEMNNSKSRGRGRKNSSTNKSSSFDKNAIRAINAEASAQKNEHIRRRELHGEVFQILVTLLMQDGPFLVLRLYLIVQFNVISEMHIFFTCKNAIVSILLVYRLCILTCRGEDKETDLYREEAAAKLHNVQLAIMAAHLVEEQRHNIRVQ